MEKNIDLKQTEHTVLEIKGRKYQYLETAPPLASGNITGNRTVVFLHGLGGSKEGAPSFYQPLLDKYRCLFIDLPAHNGIPIYDLKTLDDFADYVIDLFDHLGIKEMSLVGFSLGGLIAVKVAEKRMSRGIVTPCVLWAVPVNLNKSFITAKASFCINFIDLLPGALYRKVLRSGGLFELFSKMGMRLSEKDRVALSRFDNRSMRMLKEVFKETTVLNTDIPMLFLFGKNDVFVADSVFNTLELKSGKHRKVLVEDGGHFGTREGWTESLRVISEFIGGDEGNRTPVLKA